MKCEICGYDSTKPIGNALQAGKKDDIIEVELNNNGRQAITCPLEHLKTSNNPNEIKFIIKQKEAK